MRKHSFTELQASCLEFDPDCLLEWTVRKAPCPDSLAAQWRVCLVTLKGSYSGCVDC